MSLQVWFKLSFPHIIQYSDGVLRWKYQNLDSQWLASGLVSYSISYSSPTGTSLIHASIDLSIIYSSLLVCLSFMHSLIYHLLITYWYVPHSCIHWSIYHLGQLLCIASGHNAPIKDVCWITTGTTILLLCPKSSTVNSRWTTTMYQS